MTDNTDETSWDWDTIGILMPALGAVSFSLAADTGGELALVLRGVGAILLVSGLVGIYLS